MELWIAGCGELDSVGALESCEISLLDATVLGKKHENLLVGQVGS